jgi:hypothetical protein
MLSQKEVPEARFSMRGKDESRIKHFRRYKSLEIPQHERELTLQLPIQKGKVGDQFNSIK